jgi:hypothetical protein
VHPDGPRNFWCANCKREFDGQDDGDVGYRSPEINAERAERREMARKGQRRL